VVGQKPPKEVVKRLKEIAKRPIHYTKDCPELTPEGLREFAFLRAEKNRQKKKRAVSVRLMSSILEKYKALGDGYTGVMADVLTYAMEHPEILKSAQSNT
jgi:uncharacterized protein (DUF4415 family)